MIEKSSFVGRFIRCRAATLPPLECEVMRP
jgi:hypothetical protein